MEYCTTIGIDVSDRTSKVCVMRKMPDGERKIIVETTTATTKEGFGEVFAKFDRKGPRVWLKDEQPVATLTIPPPIAASKTGLTAAHNCLPNSFQFTLTFIVSPLTYSTTRRTGNSSVSSTNSPLGVA